MKYKKSFKKFVEGVLGHGISFMMLSAYELRVAYSDEPDSEMPLAAAKTETDCTYRRIVITIYPHMQETYNRDRSEATGYLLHECIHPVLEPLYDLIVSPYKTGEDVNRTVEQTTQQLMYIMLEQFKKEVGGE
jgi:hypothetical protein